MSLAVNDAQYVTAAGFVALGIATVVDWLRHHGRSRAYLAGSLLCLAVVAALGRVRHTAPPGGCPGRGHGDHVR